MMRNITYIFYYIIKTPWPVFNEYVRDLSALSQRSVPNILLDIFLSSVKYGTSFMDYFTLRFFNKSKEERAEYAGTGFMYQFQLKMNPKGRRNVLQDKIQFLEFFENMHGRKWFTINDLDEKADIINSLLNEVEKLVLKDSKGQAGKEVEIYSVTSSTTLRKLKAYMVTRRFDLIEEYVVQHSDLREIAPNALNTVRIITQYAEGQVYIIAAILRMSVYANTDNLSTGGCAASINVRTGIVEKSAVFMDFRKENIETHPLSGKSIVGFQVPHWEKCCDLVTAAAMSAKENRSIGWDVAIKEDGPILVEANHNWGKNLWQLPAERGLKGQLIRYL